MQAALREAGRGGYARAVGWLLAAALLLALPAVLPDKQVQVRADGQVFAVSTAKRYVAQALEEAGVELRPGDLVVPQPAAPLRPGTEVRVYRCVPLVVVADGARREFSSPGPTVGDVLRQLGLGLGEHDEVIPDLSAPLTPGLEIRVARVSFQEETRREPLPYPVEKRDEEGLPYGLTRLLRKGQPGIEEVTYRVKYADGERVASEPVARRTLRPPVSQLVAVGRASSLSRGGQVIRFVRAMEVTATAYYPGPESCGPGATGYTYTGRKAGRGIVAVDPRVIPLGTRLYVDGYGFGLAADIGGAIKGYKIDLCYDTLPEAERWGKRKVIAYLLP